MKPLVTSPSSTTAKRRPAKSAKRGQPKRIALPLTADQRELRAAVKLAQADYIQRFPEREPSSAEKLARAASVQAMFAAWEEDYRKNPPTREECEDYDRMLERMRRERAG
jgi:hypothetical protein